MQCWKQKYILKNEKRPSTSLFVVLELLLYLCHPCVFFGSLFQSLVVYSRMLPETQPNPANYTLYIVWAHRFTQDYRLLTNQHKLPIRNDECEMLKQSTSSPLPLPYVWKDTKNKWKKWLFWFLYIHRLSRIFFFFWFL